MKADMQTILAKQAAWQRSRVSQPWAEKLRRSASMRRSMVLLKKDFGTDLGSKPTSEE